MTIDERLERLVERHEALTQGVELMATEGRRLQALVESHERRMVSQSEELTETRHMVMHLSAQIERLETRAEAELRGRRLDDRIEKLTSAIGRLIEQKGAA